MASQAQSLKRAETIPIFKSLPSAFGLMNSMDTFFSVKLIGGILTKRPFKSSANRSALGSKAAKNSIIYAR